MNVIYHSTFYPVDSFIAKRAAAVVVTAFDMIPEWMESNSPGTNKHSNLAPRESSFRNADGIAAISESTKLDLEKYYPGTESKTRVTLLASDLNQLAPKTVSDPLPFQSFFLFVGNRSEYKNGDIALQSFLSVSKEHPDTGFIFFGGRPWSAAETDFLKKHQLDKRVLRVDGSDELLIHYYQKAVALIYPSCYEGFGLPVLEAMQFGCPVITTRKASLPEVGGAAVVYADPIVPVCFATQMNNLFTDPSLRARLVRAGRQQCKSFSWHNTALQTALLYRETLKKKAHV